MVKRIVFVVLVIFIFVEMTSAKGYLRLEYGKALEYNNYAISIVNVGYKFDFWSIQSRTYFEYKNWAEQDKIYKNRPFEDIYGIGQEFKYKNGIFVHFKHYCCHPVVSKIHTTEYSDGSHKDKVEVHDDMWTGTISTVTVGYEVEF